MSYRKRLLSLMKWNWQQKDRPESGINNVRDFHGEQMGFLDIRAVSPGKFIKELETDS